MGARARQVFDQQAGATVRCVRLFRNCIAPQQLIPPPDTVSRRFDREAEPKQRLRDFFSSLSAATCACLPPNADKSSNSVPLNAPPPSRRCSPSFRSIASPSPPASSASAPASSPSAASAIPSSASAISPPAAPARPRSPSPWPKRSRSAASRSMSSPAAMAARARIAARVRPDGSRRRVRRRAAPHCARGRVPVYVAPSASTPANWPRLTLLQSIDKMRFKPRVVHLLDDGFQHRQLHRDADILLLNRATGTIACSPPAISASRSRPSAAPLSSPFLPATRTSS
jgi:hypothetical protein